MNKWTTLNSIENVQLVLCVRSVSLSIFGVEHCTDRSVQAIERKRMRTDQTCDWNAVDVYAMAQPVVGRGEGGSQCYYGWGAVRRTLVYSGIEMEQVNAF